MTGLVSKAAQVWGELLEAVSVVAAAHSLVAFVLIKRNHATPRTTQLFR